MVFSYVSKWKEIHFSRERESDGRIILTMIYEFEFSFVKDADEYNFSSIVAKTIKVFTKY
jgi:hypothetical protein